MAAVALLPSLVAVIVADPAATPVTRPLLLTVATAVLLLPQVTTRPVRIVPAKSFVVAVSCCESPTVIVAELGLTLTEATGTLITVIVALPLLPSLVAVMAVDPAATPVATPMALTVANAVLPDVQAIVRPVRVLPAESRAVAVNVAVPPTAPVAVAGVTVTEATGTFVTVRAVVPLLPSLVAVMDVDPTPTPVTTPVVLTVPTVVLPDVQAITRPVKMLLAESRSVAVNAPVCPTNTVAGAGVTVTDVTGIGVTTITEVSATPEVSTASTLSRPGVAFAW
jgi:hypothetical protein